jgi:hypothetical protein
MRAHKLILILLTQPMGRILSVFGKDVDGKHLDILCYPLLKPFNQAWIINYQVSRVSPLHGNMLLIHDLVSMRLRTLAAHHSSSSIMEPN